MLYVLLFNYDHYITIEYYTWKITLDFWMVFTGVRMPSWHNLDLVVSLTFWHYNNTKSITSLRSIRLNMKNDKEETVYRALVNFNSNMSADLVVRKGDLLYVYTSSMEQNWWRVKNKRTNRKGMIPKNFIIKNEINYENFEGFFNFSRQEAYLKLMIPGINCGTFLIRPSKGELFQLVIIKNLR